MSFQRIDTKWRDGSLHHRYELDGRKLLGVTTAIGDAIPKPALIQWAATSAAEYAADHVDILTTLERDAIVDLIKTEHRRRTASAGRKGSSIHALAQQIGQGNAVDVPDELVGYVDAYLRFMDEWKVEIVAVERPVYNRRYWYGGTFDLIARFGNRELCDMIDLKTGGTGVFPEACLQLAAYRHAEFMIDVNGREVPMPTTGGGYALWLIDDGTYQLLPVRADVEMFAIFLHACKVAGFMNTKREELIGGALPTPVEVPA